MSAKVPLTNQWEQVGREWREAGQHLKTYGEMLMRAFQSGWEDEQAQVEFAKLTEQMRASATRLDSALRAARETAIQQDTQGELAEARARTLKAAEDSQQLIATALDTLSESLKQLSDQAKAWKQRQTGKS